MAGGTTTPLGIDTTVPTPARMYDFWLGGHDNFAVDRAAALAVSEAAPEVRLMAMENRKFLRRAVRYLAAEAGIDQFLDIGTGLPTQGNVHQVAQQVNPDARVRLRGQRPDGARPLARPQDRREHRRDRGGPARPGRDPDSSPDA